ncbi:MAG: IS701 family transposase, partial [Pseudonocardiaceae bacterium]
MLFTNRIIPAQEGSPAYFTRSQTNPHETSGLSARLSQFWGHGGDSATVGPIRTGCVTQGVNEEASAVDNSRLLKSDGTADASTPEFTRLADRAADGVSGVLHRAHLHHIRRAGRRIHPSNRSAHRVRHAHRRRLERAWRHGRAHRFFSAASWSADAAGLVLSDLIVTLLVPAGAALTVAVDDALFHRSGKRVHAAGWCHDGSAEGPKKVAWGNNWVIAGLVVDLPFMTRPVCLPVLFRLWKPKGVTKLVLARQLVDTLAERYPGRKIHVVADAAYATRELRSLPAQVTVTSRLRRNAALYDLAPPRTGKRGRPRLKGKRLGAPADLAAAASWRKVIVTRYGRDEQVWAVERRCLWYGALGCQQVRLVLVREAGRDHGYDLALATTDPDSPT